MGTLGYLSLLGGDAKRNGGYGPSGVPRNPEDEAEQGGETIVSPPRDVSGRIYYGLILAGVGFLLPYNSFIVAVDYFQDKYPGSTIIFDISTVYIFSALAAVLVNNLLVETLSLNTRISFGYIVSFSTLAFVAVFEVWLQVIPESIAYSVTLLAVVLLAVGCTVQQSSFYGYTSMLPNRYTQAVMTGESAAGLIVSVNRILSKDLINDLRINTLCFFLICIIIVVLCSFIHRFVRDSDFAAFYVGICKRSKNSFKLVETEDRRELMGEGPSDPDQPRRRSDVSVEGDLTFPQFGPSCNVNPDIGDKINDMVVGFGGKVKSVSGWGPMIKAGLKARYEISKLIFPHMLAISLAYFTTLCLFPGIESEIVSCSLASWMPVLLMATFNLFDLLGKIASSYLRSAFNGSNGLVLGSACRILLIPLMLLCASPRHAPVISGETPAFIICALLGVTNGIFGSLPMILAPEDVADGQKELAGNIMTLSYSIGLTLGTCTAYFLDNSLGEPNHRICGEQVQAAAASSTSHYPEDTPSFNRFNLTAQNISIPY